MTVRCGHSTRQEINLKQDRDDRAIGRISIHPAGYGFVVVEDGTDDVFVPAKYRGDALDGDQVVLETWDGYKGTEGKVVKILARGRAKLTGELACEGRAVFVVPDDPRIATDYGRILLEDGTGGAKEGEAVVVEITKYPSGKSQEIRGRVTAVLGDPEDPRTEIEKILVCSDIPRIFPAEAVAQGERTHQELRAEDFADRIDLRDRPFVTIDPETARDFDDALCIEEGPGGGWRVWIAVADVSHYVRQTDALDREAQIRGVSVYLPDRVIPMLPMQLSAGICSLNPEVDRCAMVVRLDFDDKAKVRNKGFAAAVIRSHARLDYPGAAAALAGDFRGRRESYRQWQPALLHLDSLAQKLRKRRLGRGALDLELPEAKVILDADDPRLVRDVVRAKGQQGVKRAYQLVEEFMIAANEAVGSFFRERELPTVWRVHAPPKPDRIAELAEVLQSYGVHVDPDEARTPTGMRKLVEQIVELPASRSLMFLILRSLKQAVYQIENLGHFGLASEEYLHFTSPIRRYPDLIVHRLLKHQLHIEGQASGGAAEMVPPKAGMLQDMAAGCSGHERRAMDAEREAVSMYRAFLMRAHVGEEFPGRVSAITSFGAFVELDEPFVEGLIKLEAIGEDYYGFDKSAMRLVGQRTGHTLSLGDTVVVEILNASVTLRRIELGLISGGSKSEPRERTRRERPGATEPRRGARRGAGKQTIGVHGKKPRGPKDGKPGKSGGKAAGKGKAAAKPGKKAREAKKKRR
jgi:ribonuclease R